MVADGPGLGVQVVGSFVGTITFEAAIDGSNWEAVQALKVGDGTVTTLPDHRRRGKQKRQSQMLMELPRLALCMVIGQACETTTTAPLPQ